MKRITCLLFAIMGFLAGLSAQGNAFWTKVKGPSGTDLNDITCTDSGILYQQMDNSNAWDTPVPATLYRTSDQGEHWTKLNPMLNGQLLTQYIDIGTSGTFRVVFPDDVNSVTSPGTLYRSYDEGLELEQVATDLPFQRVFETPGGTLLAHRHTTKQLWRSADGGVTWNEVINGPYWLFFDSNLKILQNGGLTIKANFPGLYYSSDDGQSWQTILLDSVQEAYNLSELFISSAGTLFAATGGAAFRSTDNGQSWLQMNDTQGSSSFLELADGSLLCSDLQSKLLRSTDDGQSWQVLNSNHAIGRVFPVRLSDGAVFGKFWDGLYRSADGGQTWQFAARDLDLAEVTQMAFCSEDTIFAATANGLQRSFDRGANWEIITDNASSAIINSRSFAAGQHGRLAVYANKKLYWSEDYGQTLTDITPPFASTSYAVAMSPDDSLLFLNAGPGTNQIARSADHGASWQLANCQKLRMYQMEFHPSGRLFASGNTSEADENVWYSDDGGLNWLPVQGLPIQIVTALLIDPAGNIYVAFSQPEYALYRSTDNGDSWLKHPGVFPDYIDELSANTLGHVFLNDYSRSLDLGVTWHDLPQPYATNIPLLDPISPAQYLYTNLIDLGLYRTVNPTSHGAYVSGFVRQDADAECSTPDAQMPLANWIVEADGPYDYFANTDSTGHYLIFVDSTGVYEVQTQVPNPWWWESQEAVQSVQIDSFPGDYAADFAVVATSGCPLMTVDLAIPGLRRCFDNTLYVNYCNQGSEPADSAWVEVMLDPFVDFVSASLPAEDLGDKTYRFYVGDVASTECGQFSIVVNVDCDSTVFGQTHCFSAHAFPDTLCTSIPNWSGAIIRASAICQDTVVRLSIKNISDIPSSNLDFIIIVDDVVLMMGNQNYGPGQEIILNQPADGRTWRIESEQEPGHPFATSNHIALAFAEGCGGFESLGYINQYPVDEFDPSYDRECLENTSSYDPNDKQGLPLGTGAAHQIRPGQDLEYLVRFQNTGTDTAFTVMIRDTLSAWLDAATVRPGASSHPYTWNLSGQGILQFNFNQIMLPDSNVNEAGSHGFISFRIQQQPGLPVGTQILNEAGIYFDFNAPIFTNQTLHTIGVPVFTGVYAAFSAKEEQQMQVSPNPASDHVVIRPDNDVFKEHRVTVTDARGTIVRQLHVNGPQCLIERKSLPQGLYFFQVEQASGRAAGSGSFLFMD